MNEQNGSRLPLTAEALALLQEANSLNPGPWSVHSKTVADCARRIAALSGMDEDKAYLCGLLHDIGRRFGTRHFGHIVDGTRYMQSLGYDDIARVCLSHSFPTQEADEYIGNIDVSEAEYATAIEALVRMEYDDYDRLIQLCDSIAGVEIMDLEARMNDVATRYGYYPEKKRLKNIWLKEYFERKMNADLYSVIRGEPKPLQRQ